ncbi:MAG: ribosome-binding factor A [Acidimicrobiales bacterium]
MAARRYDNRGAAPYPRALRVNQVLRQVLAEELERLADADDRLELITVTAVDTAPDLSHATVYVSSMGTEAAEALGERRAQLQRAVGRQVRMKRTPLLEFAVDPAVVAGERVESSLRRIRQSESAAGTDRVERWTGGNGVGVSDPDPE